MKRKEFCFGCSFYTTEYDLEEDIALPICGCVNSEHYNDNVPPDCTCASWTDERVD